MVKIENFGDKDMDEVVVYLIKYFILLVFVMLVYGIFRTSVELIVFKKRDDRNSALMLVYILGFVGIGTMLFWGIYSMGLGYVKLLIMLFVAYWIVWTLLGLFLPVILRFVVRYNEEVVGRKNVIFFRNNLCEVKGNSGCKVILLCDGSNSITVRRCEMIKFL